MRTLNTTEVSHVNGGPVGLIIRAGRLIGKAVSAAKKRPVSTGAGAAAGAASTQIGKED